MIRRALQIDLGSLSKADEFFIISQLTAILSRSSSKRRTDEIALDNTLPSTPTPPTAAPIPAPIPAARTHASRAARILDLPLGRDPRARCAGPHGPATRREPARPAAAAPRPVVVGAADVVARGAPVAQPLVLGHLPRAREVRPAGDEELVVGLLIKVVREGLGAVDAAELEAVGLGRGVWGC